jgi:soluble lytic murein transglycosylase-like protein
VALIRGSNTICRTICAAAALTLLTPFAYAAELVTLTNGYAMRCDHHAQVEDHVRLYMSAGEDNYIEFPSRDIVNFEQAPDLPVPQAAPSAVPQAGPQSGAKNTARLTGADLDEMLNTAGKEHNVDVDLLASIVKAESGGNAHAVSHAGAQGLMQLMPRTASELGVHDSFQPEQNVRGGTAYLDALLTRYGNNLALALAAYNAGPEAVDKYHGIPPYHETRVYVARVIHEFNRRVLARVAQEKHALASSSAQSSAR